MAAQDGGLAKVMLSSACASACAILMALSPSPSFADGYDGANNIDRVITPRAAFEAMKNGELYIDVRNEEKFAQGHLKGAVNIPVLIKPMASALTFGQDAGIGEALVNYYSGELQINPSFTRKINRLVPNRGTPIIIGCKAGSCTPALVLVKEIGYLDVRSEKRGLNTWLSDGLPVEQR
jgi:rhodanese-related sulfurtransferase